MFAIYGSGIAGTFAWLFFALSGTPVCASGLEPCRVVVGLAGQLSLVWPIYWGGRISGNAAMTPMAPVEVVVAVLAFLAVLAFAQAYSSLERKEQGTAAERKPDETARNEPLIKTSALTGNKRKHFLARRGNAPCSESGTFRPAAGRDCGFGGPVREASGARQEARGGVGRA